MRLVMDTFRFLRAIPAALQHHLDTAGTTSAKPGPRRCRSWPSRCATGSSTWNGRSRGLAVDDFAPRLSFFFNAHNDFFEEIAKYRAARKLWAELMRDRFGARKPNAVRQLRFHAQTAGCLADLAAARTTT